MLFSKPLIAAFLAAGAALAVPETMSLTLVDVDGGEHVVSWPFFESTTQNFYFGKNIIEIRGDAEGWPGRCYFYSGSGFSPVLVASIGPLAGGEAVVQVQQEPEQHVLLMYCDSRVVG
jgi:hypothetical protein